MKAKRNQKTEEGPEYYQQVLGAVIVRPDHATVLPLDFEPISRADGAQKNDCERNAGKRLIASMAEPVSQAAFRPARWRSGGQWATPEDVARV